MSAERLRQRLSQIQENLGEAERRSLMPLNEPDTERLVVEPVLDALAQWGSKLDGTEPVAFKLPDGGEKPVATWVDLYESIVYWLVVKRGLPRLPFSATARWRKYMLNSEPEQANGKMKAHRRLDTPTASIYLDTNNSTRSKIANLVVLCREIGQPPEAIQVLLPEV